MLVRYRYLYKKEKNDILIFLFLGVSVVHGEFGGF